VSQEEYEELRLSEDGRTRLAEQIKLLISDPNANVSLAAKELWATGKLG
jgi:hypothetical protein